MARHIEDFCSSTADNILCTIKREVRKHWSDGEVVSLAKNGSNKPANVDKKKTNAWVFVF